MTVDGRAVANFILDFADSKNWKLTHLDLQKLIFFCHAWTLVSTGNPLVKEKFEAWQYGPVLKYIYREFKRYGNQPILSRATKLNRFNGQSEIVPPEIPEELLATLESVLNFYGRLPTGQLVELSHAKGGPWDTVWNHKSFVNPGMRIENNDILSYYSSLAPNVRFS